MRQHDASQTPVTGPWIEIRGGRTRFPQRPIEGDRFLIGSGSNCQLQLGGGMPMAHSVISYGPGGWTIEALVPEPPLRVEGKVVRQASLFDGEVIELGPFTLVAHLAAVAERDLLNPIDVARTVALADVDAPHRFVGRLAEFTAEELVERLTADLAAAVIDGQGPSATGELLQESIAAETTGINEEELIADVMAQLAEMTARIAMRPRDSISIEESMRTPIPHDADGVPLRKSA
ncbi:hypothetical protein Pan44_18500 [Caulifigura coniformis]|uniref:FHA domain-containing protein n=1 Tax=Caulifigura coniformis TaxID=2527983 RepID=A0A517SCJ9_9PLAN|nr:FHA domain-containing protein [Caulifigura coniformis]QDT53826.1 hypothetical protein Pan44_18500 [Caulifigura coniformis]